jgi:hypothetical protein
MMSSLGRFAVPITEDCQALSAAAGAPALAKQIACSQILLPITSVMLP